MADATAPGESVAAVIVAGGQGRRFGDGKVPKQFRLLAGFPVLQRSVEAFVRHPDVHEVVVVLPDTWLEDPPDWLSERRLVAGGAERGDSVRCGLDAVQDQRGLVLVHDGARPLVSAKLITAVIRAARERGASVPGLPVTDTLKQVLADGRIERTIDRSRLVSVQTPQAFRIQDLRDLHQRAASAGLHFTDDAGLAEHFAQPVFVVPGDPMNIKITTPRDLQIAETILADPSELNA